MLVNIINEERLSCDFELICNDHMEVLAVRFYA